MTRRNFLSLALAALAGAGAAGSTLAGCGPRRRGRGPGPHPIRRAIRRRRRRRIRRRVLWRVIGPRRVIVVPVDLDGDDELELEDGRVVKVVEVRAETKKVVVVDADGNEDTLDAEFEGESGEPEGDG